MTKTKTAKGLHKLLLKANTGVCACGNWECTSDSAAKIEAAHARHLCIAPSQDKAAAEKAARQAVKTT